MFPPKKGGERKDFHMKTAHGNFRKITADQFNDLVARTTGDEYDETDMDGHSVSVVHEGKNCIAIWYHRAETGSTNPDYIGDLVSYCEEDTLYPFD
jgi:hypothetical protein